VVKRRTCNRKVAGSNRVPAAPLHVTTLGKLFTHNVPLFTKQYKLVPAIGWEVVGLASHWQCVTDSVVYPPTGSVAWEREMSTTPKLRHLYLYNAAAHLPGKIRVVDELRLRLLNACHAH